MATNIDIDDVTNATEVNNGTGIFDKLIYAAFLHINHQVDENRLTQGAAGEVYAAAIQSAMSQAIQFTLQKGISEAQIKTAYVERVIKDKEAAALGMDNAIKISQTSKASDDTYVYTPQYEEL